MVHHGPWIDLRIPETVLRFGFALCHLVIAAGEKVISSYVFWTLELPATQTAVGPAKWAGLNGNGGDSIETTKIWRSSE